MPRSRRTLFVTYAITSWLYRWFVTFSILFFLYQFLPPKLRVISAMIALSSLVPLIVMPLWQMFKFVRQPGRMRKVKKARAAAFFATVGVVVAAILMIPTPLRLKGTLVLTPTKPQRVYLEVPGRLESLLVRDHQPVKAGDEIARFSNLDLLLERVKRQEEIDVNLAKASTFDKDSSPDSLAHLMAEQHRENARDLEPALTNLIDQIGKLTLIAAQDGIAIGIPPRESTGKWIQPGELFCEVGDPRRLEAHIIIDQSDIDLIRFDSDGKGPRAWVKVYGTSETTWKSRVSQVAKRNIDEIPPELSNMAGGEIATKPDQKTGAAKPLSAVYEVVIPIDNPNELLQVGQRGFAKIDAGTHTLGWWLWRLITKTFHFTL